MLLTYCQTIVIASLVLIAGCSQSGPQVAPVHGRITLDGQPLPDTSVVFKRPICRLVGDAPTKMEITS